MTSKRLKDLTVILTGAGAPGWPDICNCLADNGERNIRIVAVDMDSDVAGYHLVRDACTVPAGMAPDYIEKIVELVKQHQADAIVPLTDFELLPLARHKDTFKKMGAVIPVASVPALEIATDKIRLHECLGQADPSTPAFGVAHTLQGFENSVYTLGYPDKKVCFKPGIAHGSRGFRILDPQAAASKTFFTAKAEEMRYAMTLENAKSLLDEIKGFPPLLLTEFLPGTEYSVDLLLQDNHVLAAVCRERTRVRFGLTYHGQVVDKDDILEAAVRIAKKIGLDHNANLQFKLDAEGHPKILEINPRTSGTIALCRAAGVNLPYLGLKLALGERVQPAQPKVGTRNYRFWTHVFLDADGNRINL